MKKTQAKYQEGERTRKPKTFFSEKNEAFRRPQGYLVKIRIFLDRTFYQDILKTQMSKNNRNFGISGVKSRDKYHGMMFQLNFKKI